MTTILIVDDDTGIRTLVTDYLTKPFSTRELLARIRAVLRRSPDHLPVIGTGAMKAMPFVAGACV